MLTLTKLRNAEYVLSQIAGGLDEYYTSGREAPGVWAGRWSERLGLDGVVEADHLRYLVRGTDPRTGLSLVEGRERRVNAFDATFSAPKSASLLWAFGGPEAESAVSVAHVESVSTALSFLESHVAVARQQKNGVRSQVPTEGLAVATFVHRTSRAGDPQLHTHCVIPNLARRPDGTHVALDAGPLYEWGRAAGCVYQEELRRRLTASLGVTWGPDRNGTREMLGFSELQLRAFSKRTAQIEAWLEAHGSSAPQTPAERMAADEAASLATRSVKDETLGPEALAARWAEEAREVGLRDCREIAKRICARARCASCPER